MGEAQLSSVFFDLVTFVISLYVGSGFGSGSVEHSTGSTTLRVRLVLILGGEELVGEAQLATNFFDLLTCHFILCLIRPGSRGHPVPVPQLCV